MLKCFDVNDKCKNFLVDNKKLLEVYNLIWNKFGNLSEKGFDFQSVYDNKYVRTNLKFYNNKINTSLQNKSLQNKIPSYNNKINADFNGNKIPEEGVRCTCCSII